MSGWLDIISLGIDAVQLRRLGQMRGSMQTLEQSRMAEIQEQEIIKAMRNVVFASLKSAEALEPHLEASPQPVYVVAGLLQWRMLEYGIAPEVFPEFADKEYVLSAQKRIGEISAAAAERLSPEQISQAEECGRAIVEMGTLDQAIETFELRDSLRDQQAQLQATDEEWLPLNKLKRSYTMAGLGIMVGFPALACCGFTFLGGFASSNVRGNGTGILAQSGGVLLAVACLFALVAIGMGIWLVLRDPSPRYKELRAQRLRMNQNRNVMTGKLPDKATLDKIASTFGAKDTAGLHKIRQARQALIEGIMGQIEGYGRYLGSSTAPMGEA